MEVMERSHFCVSIHELKISNLPIRVIDIYYDLLEHEYDAQVNK